MKSPREVIQEWVTAFNSRDAARAAARYHEDATNWQVAAGEPKVSRSRIVVDGKNEEPAASSGVSELGDEIGLKAVTPECFYWGSRSGFVCGEPSRTIAKSMRE